MNGQLVDGVLCDYPHNRTKIPNMYNPGMTDESYQHIGMTKYTLIPKNWVS